MIAVVWAALCATNVSARHLEARVSFNGAEKTAVVEGKWSGGREERNLSFLASAIGAERLAERIGGISLTDNAGGTVSYKRFNAAEYVAATGFSSFRYVVDLSPVSDPRSAAHSSWIDGDRGIIFIDDILPLGRKDETRAVFTVKVPERWNVASTAQTGDGLVFDLERPEREVLLIGKGIRISDPAVGGRLSLVAAGKWLFTDLEAARMASEIFLEYEDAFGSSPSGPLRIVVLPFPQPNVRAGTWEAETRGSTVVIVSADMPFQNQSSQRLHEQLRHEIFHLWLPNAVYLSGSYDWFYEGFALYRSLKAGVTLNRIRFDDMLDTLSRAHNIDRSQGTPISLLDASQRRWAGADAELYARGMLIAFMADLAMLKNSGGRQNIDTLLGHLFSSYKLRDRSADGNKVILGFFDADPALRSIADDHIRGSRPIDLAAFAAAAGIENDPGTSRTRLRITSRPNGRQKALLDKLGYNSWRKLTRK